MVLVRASRYFLTMGIERLSVEEAKDFWFAGDLTVCTMNMDDQVWALPLIEVERGFKYLTQLKACKTLGDAQNLYKIFLNDDHAPKFLPNLVDLESQEDPLIEAFEEVWGIEEWTKPWKEADEYPAIDLIWENVKESAFDFTESKFYRDSENDVIAIYGRPQLWTDEWMPLEIVNKLGIKDDAWGIDYIPAEYVYSSQPEFTKLFKSLGFEVIEDDVRLGELSGYR